MTAVALLCLVSAVLLWNPRRPAWTRERGVNPPAVRVRDKSSVQGSEPIDLVLDLGPDAVRTLECCFPEAEFYRPPTEVIESELVRSQRGHFNLIHLATMLKADVYLRGADELHRWALDHRRRIEVDAHPISFAPPEYVILRKLQFFAEGGSEKHLRDIASMLGESGDQIDLDWVETRSRDYGLSAHWYRARSFRG